MPDPFTGRDPMTDTQILRQLYQDVQAMRMEWESDRSRIDELERFRSMLKGVFLGWGLILAPAIAAFIGYTLSS